MCIYIYTFLSPKGKVITTATPVYWFAQCIFWEGDTEARPSPQLFLFSSFWCRWVINSNITHNIIYRVYTCHYTPTSTPTCMHNLHMCQLHCCNYSILSTSNKEDWEWWNCSEHFDSRLFIWGRLSYCVQVHDHLTLNTYDISYLSS